MAPEIRKEKATSLIARKILEQIESGKLKPGSKLPSQRELGTQFGYGRSSIREAITTLVGMGYLHVIHGKGTFVRENGPPPEPPVSSRPILESGTLIDLMEARELLECKATELAAKRADLDDIRKIEFAVKELCDSGNDISKFIRSDLDFHHAVAEASKNTVLCELSKLLFTKVHKYSTHFRATSSPKVMVNTCKTATRILHCIAEGDGKKAARGMNQHLRIVTGELRKVLIELAPMLTGIRRNP